MATILGDQGYPEKYTDPLHEGCSCEEVSGLRGVRNEVGIYCGNTKAISYHLNNDYGWASCEEVAEEDGSRRQDDGVPTITFGLVEGIWR